MPDGRLSTGDGLGSLNHAWVLPSESDLLTSPDTDNYRSCSSKRMGFHALARGFPLLGSRARRGAEGLPDVDP